MLFSRRNGSSGGIGIRSSTSSGSINNSSNSRSPSPVPNPNPNRRPTNSSSPAPSIHPATIDTKNYNIPWSVLLLIEQIVDILDISECYPDMNVDIMSKIVILCQLFDQKTDKLVLGAEAMQMAGLKSITAKHLAYAAQSYDLLLALIPHIRTFKGTGVGIGIGIGIAGNKNNSNHNSNSNRIGSRNSMSVLPSKMKFDALDAVSNSITEHHSAILTKFVRIVEDMMDSIASNRLRNHDWDKTNASGSSSSSSSASTTNTGTNSNSNSGSNTNKSSNKTMQVDYFEDIVKMINSLHKTLVLLLPITQVVEVFSRIFNILKIKLLLHFDVPDATNTTTIK